MARIESLCEHFAVCRDELGAHINAMNDDVQRIKEQYLGAIRAALRTYNTAEDDLRAAVGAAPALFDKPRTRVLHGVRVGYQKGKGAMTVADPPRTLELIRKMLPDQVETLIRANYSPVKEALAQLDAQTLKRLGVHLTNAVDDVVVRATDTDMDKLIKALQGDDGLKE
ncbi:MAG: hypothetical protein U0973_11620 [Xanthomonadaceae bacterium]|nr:hypothetical protein [Xanthomonadaceae bacterium]